MGDCKKNVETLRMMGKCSQIDRARQPAFGHVIGLGDRAEISGGFNTQLPTTKLEFNSWSGWVYVGCMFYKSCATFLHCLIATLPWSLYGNDCTP